MPNGEPTPTPEQVKAMVELLRDIFALIKTATAESPLRGIPSGHLYAAVSDVMDLDTYNRLILVMKDSGLIEEVNYLLRALPDKQA